MAGYVAAFFRNAWHAADEVFAPRALFLGEKDEEIEQLYKWRNIIGGILVLSVALRYHDLSGIPRTGDVVMRGADWTAGFAFASVIPSCAVVIAGTRRASREKVISQLRYPAAAAGTWILAYFAVSVFSRVQGSILRGGPVVAVVALVLLSWFAVFLVRACYHMAAGLFRLGDAHPLLPPAVSVLASWVLAARTLFAGGGDAAEPSALAVLMLIGGPVSLTVVAVMEVTRLQQRYPDHFPFRDGPLT